VILGQALIKGLVHLAACRFSSNALARLKEARTMFIQDRKEIIPLDLFLAYCLGERPAFINKCIISWSAWIYGRFGLLMHTQDPPLLVSLPGYVQNALLRMLTKQYTIYTRGIQLIPRCTVYIFPSQMRSGQYFFGGAMHFQNPKHSK